MNNIHYKISIFNLGLLYMKTLVKLRSVHLTVYTVIYWRFR